MPQSSDPKKFLYDLLVTPSPSGFEAKIQEVVRKRMAPFADTIETDVHGNVIVGINTKASRRVMLAGHCDQIGFMVKHISSDGYVYVGALGGLDPSVLWGSHVSIYGSKEIVTGVFGRKPIHLQSGEERSKAPVDLDKMWIDIGAKNKKDAEKRVAIGDVGTFRLGVTEFNKDIIVSPGLDDKAGLFVVMEALRLCAGKKLSVALYAVSTVQEEMGLRGATTAAYGIDPHVGIGVDVGFATDNPASENPKASPFKLGGGPGTSKGPNINSEVYSLLINAAKKSKIPHQVLPAPGLLGNDTRTIQVSRKGVATGTVAIPVRYMHTQVEAVDYNDLTNSAKMLTSFVQSITPKTSFIPKA